HGMPRQCRRGIRRCPASRYPITPIAACLDILAGRGSTMAPTTFNRVKRMTPAVLTALFVLLLPAAVIAQREVPPFRISALKAMLFYGQTASFSPDLFGPSAPILQNVSTGEGQANATLGVVEITGRPDSFAATRKVALTAAAGTRTLLTKTQALGRPGDDGKFYAAFWLYDTGCKPVVLKARIVGQSQD